MDDSLLDYIDQPRLADDVILYLWAKPQPRLTGARCRQTRAAFGGLQAPEGHCPRPVWGDGHSTGIYSFDYLLQLAARPENQS